MNSQRLMTLGLQIPVLLRVLVNDDEIKVTSYEELLVQDSKEMDPEDIENRPESLPLEGRITNLPLGKTFNRRYENLSSGPAMASTQMPSFGRSKPAPLKVNRSRNLVVGEDLGENLKGRYFAKLSSACLFVNDHNIAKECWKSFTRWIFEVDDLGFILAARLASKEEELGLISVHTSAAGSKRSVACSVLLGGNPRNLSEASILVNAHRDFGVSDIGGIAWNKVGPQEVTALFARPKVRAAEDRQLSVPRDAISELKMEMIDFGGNILSSLNTEVIVKSDAGYIPNKKIKILDGKLNVRIDSRAMLEGETIELQFLHPFGYRYGTVTVQVS